MIKSCKYTALITGSNKGIGLGLVKQLLENKYFVIATCRNLSKAQELQDLQKKYSKNLELMQLDITNINDIEQVKNCVRDTQIDFLINNAGVFGTFYKSVNDFNTTEFLNVINTNATYPMLLTLKLLDNILSSSKKTVIAISSIFGSLGYIANIKDFADICHKFQTNKISEKFHKQVIASIETPILPYSYSKSAINIMLSNLGLWFHDKKLKTLLLHPGNVATDMTNNLPDKEYRISINESVSKIMQIIKNSDNYRTATFIDYQNQKIDDLLNSSPQLNL